MPSSLNIEVRPITCFASHAEIMCQNLFTARIVQNIVEIIILYVFFSCYNLKYVYGLSYQKRPSLSVYDFLDIIEPHFQEIRYLFLFVRSGGSSLYLKFEKSSNKRPYRE